jgi:hypothetical protein
MQLFQLAIASLKKGLRTLSPNCRDASRLQAEAFDRPLTPWQRFGLRMHLLLCGWCRRYERQLRFLRRAVRRSDGPAGDRVPASLTAEAREKMKHAIHDHRHDR